MVLKVENGKISVLEEVGGSRGTDYYYVEIGGELRPLLQLFQSKRIYYGESRGGRRKGYLYEIPCKELTQLGGTVTLWEISFSNKGYMSIRRHIIDAVNCAVLRTEYAEDLSNIGARCDTDKVFGSAPSSVSLSVGSSTCCLLEVYMKYVPSLIGKVHDVMKKYGVSLVFGGEAVRLEEIYDRPGDAWRAAVVFTTEAARVKALESYLQMAYELYVLALVVEALGGKSRNRIWDIQKGQDWPTTVIDVGSKSFTVWFQFSIKRWIDVVLPGLIEGLTGRKMGTRSRQYVMPDVVIFEGDYKDRKDLGTPRKIVVIEAKIKFDGSDAKQVLEYTKIFGETFKGSNIKYILALIDGGAICPSDPMIVDKSAKKALEKGVSEGKVDLIVVDNVAPGKSGEEKLVEEIRKFLEI